MAAAETAAFPEKYWNCHSLVELKCPPLPGSHDLITRAGNYFLSVSLHRRKRASTHGAEVPMLTDLASYGSAEDDAINVYGPVTSTHTFPVSWCRSAKRKTVPTSNCSKTAFFWAPKSEIPSDSVVCYSRAGEYLYTLYTKAEANQMCILCSVLICLGFPDVIGLEILVLTGDEIERVVCSERKVTRDTMMKVCLALLVSPQ